MHAQALTHRPLALVALLAFLMALAVLLSLSSPAAAQQTTELAPPPPVDQRVAPAEVTEEQEGDETATADVAEVQASLENPFGRTRPMFSRSRVRGLR
jgi:uncharacterized protein YggE